MQKKRLTGWAGCLALAVLVLAGCTQGSPQPRLSAREQPQEVVQKMAQGFGVTAEGGQMVSAEQTIGGVTARAHWVQVQGSRLLLVWSVAAEDGSRAGGGRSTLILPGGLELEPTGELGMNGNSEVLQMSLPDGESVTIQEYTLPQGMDPATLQTLTLRLEATRLPPVPPGEGLRSWLRSLTDRGEPVTATEFANPAPPQPSTGPFNLTIPLNP